MLLTEKTRFLFERIKTRIRSWTWIFCSQGSGPTGSKTTETNKSVFVLFFWFYRKKQITAIKQVQQTRRFNLKSFRNIFCNIHRKTNEWEYLNKKLFFTFRFFVSKWHEKDELVQIWSLPADVKPSASFIFNLFHKSVSENLHEVFRLFVGSGFIDLFTRWEALIQFMESESFWNTHLKTFGSFRTVLLGLRVFVQFLHFWSV